MCIPILLIVQACQTYDNRLPPELPKQNEKIEDLLYNGIGIDVGSNREEALEKLGEPKRIRKLNHYNSYYEFNDEVTYYIYDGLEVGYYKHNHPEYGWDNIARIEVSSDKYQLKHNIKLGMDYSDVIGTFGCKYYPPWEDDGNKYLAYGPIDTGEHVQVIFVFRSNKLIKFIWSYFP